MMVNSFFPEVVPRFFSVPKIHQLPKSDKKLYPNEILAGFMDFLLQVLYHESNRSSQYEQCWALVRKELYFLSAVLGDIPFQCTHHELVEQVNNLLTEIEMLANDAGSFVYDGVFSIHQMEANTFIARKMAWFEKVELLNAKIKEHCFNFSELPMSVISRSSVVDSFFIIHSIIEDIENLMNPRLNFNHDDATKEHIITLHSKLTLSQSFIKVLQDDDSNEKTEGLIQIRDLSYEVEYLINSLITGNIHVWYLNLRLPSIIHKIKLTCIVLDQISESKLMNASHGKLSFSTMDDNHFVDFNDDIAQRVLEDQSNYMKILEVSYKHLPPKIKPCFLYFAAFPKDSEISKEKLTWLWIAEGFIQKEGDKSLEETAEMYLLDLINRKLVLLIAKRRFDGAIKLCRIHSVLHEFCTRKANEENFLEFTNSEFSMYEKCQRLCLPSTSSDNSWRPFGLHCRSYIHPLKRQYSSCFQTMALLKVVDQSREDYSSSCPELAFPAQLRYLGVGDLSNKMVANLLNLEFISVTSYRRVYVPSVVLRMVKLRHLLVRKKAEFEEDCSNVTETTNLRTLSRVCINGQKDEEILRCSPHLHKLKCILTDSTKFPDLSFLAQLESLKVSFRMRCLAYGILPSKINFPSNIKKLCLSESELPWEMMSIIGRLPNLHFLKLKWDAFVGDVWETRGGEFQTLKNLEVNRSRDLRLMISCSEHFPVLECLVLRECRELLEIPSDFGNIPTLQRIEVTDCMKVGYLSVLQFGKRIQVNSAREIWSKQILEHTTYKPHTFEDLSSCMEEYFKAGGPEGYMKLPIIDPKEEKTTGSTKKLTVTDIMEDENAPATTNGDDEPLIFCNHQTYSFLVGYAMWVCSNIENLTLSDTIMGLRRIAQEYKNRVVVLPGNRCYVDEIKKSRREFSDMIVRSFIPQVKTFFEVPKLEQLPDKDKHLNKNEVLAGSIDFLLQILSCQVNANSAEEELYTLLQKELSFLVAVLGDLAFQPSTHPELDDQLNNLLAEFELLANEAGGFLFSCVSPIQRMKVSRFHAETGALLEMAKLLSAKIKEHCTKFSELPVSSVIVRPNVVYSCFIVDSLLDDLQSIIECGRFGCFTPDEAIIEQMKTLHAELKLSQKFIKDMQNNEEKEGLIQIRDMTYEAEYLINSVLLGNIHLWYLDLRLPSIIDKIKFVCIGLEQISKTMVIKASDGKVLFPTTGMTRTMDHIHFLDFKGRNVTKILRDLTGKWNKPREAILIYGMPGIGKTITATKLYNDEAVISHFDRRAWCVVSENYNVRALFIQILLDLGNDPDKNRAWKENSSELGEEIHKSLKGWRYLIVLDDVWHSEVLDILQLYFPQDQNGSRVMITTRNKDVSPRGSILHELSIISEDQSWHLLEKKVFEKNPCPSDLISIGKRIAARCSGVPLAVVTVGGILINLEKKESEWKRVAEQLDTILLDNQSDYKKIMELSYDHLPHNIKSCFLYFARFPEDAEISIKELTWLWISERFIQKDGKKSPEEIAETYLLDLINRSLVMTAKRRSIGGIKTCRIHDLLRDICIKKADEVNFLNSTNLSSTYNKHQHMCVPSNINWKPFGLHCRSLRDSYGIEQSSRFQTMPLLKVMDLSRNNGHNSYGPTKVDLSFQLRYLAIGTAIPKRMADNLVNLEVLHVRSLYENVVVVPSVILRMARLRHLFVREKAKFEEDCNNNNNNISESINLRSISLIMIETNKDEEIFRNSPHLQTLKCYSKARFPDVSKLAELKSLRIDFNIRYVDVVGTIKFPLTLKKLCLSRSRFPWEKMSIIGELPNLEVLKLEYDAFAGGVWVTNDDQFKELRFLKMEESDLKQWSSESGHFPCLERLVLSRCNDLLEIPSDFGYISALQRIEVINCGEKSLYVSAIQIEQEQREYDNQELQVHITHRRWKKEELMLEAQSIETE